MRPAARSLLRPLHRCSSRAVDAAQLRHKGQGLSSRRAVATGASGDGSSTGGDPQFLQGILSGILAPYWEQQCPSALNAIELLEEKFPEACIGFDHLAFRTYGLPGLGIRSMAGLFEDFGYRQRDELAFPAKKLRALWFSPPEPDLPRIFISELQVEKLSPEAQAVIHKYCGSEAEACVMGRYSALSTVLGIQPWATPSKADYDLLAAESEYAAWVLTNGYSLNHTTVAVHALEGLQGGLDEVNSLLQGAGFLLNEEGGLTKVSPDGLLKQSSTMADRISFSFDDGDSHLVPGSYIEFAERLVLPEYRHLPPDQLREHHRRDGFETSNADRIFESTSEKHG